MVFFPNAKINLGLCVTGKRSDGYHNIQSILFPVPLYDVLELIDSPDGDFSFSMSGIPVDGDHRQNLVYRVWQMMQLDFELPPVKMHLHKAIPMGAGLGGGSADAAFLIRLVNAHFKLGLSTEKMREIAVRLGMDCPFFIENVPALATERGDKLSSIELDLKGKHLVLVKPDCHVSTRDAYAGVKPKKPGVDLEEAIKKPVGRWKELLVNDFEKSVFKVCPQVGIIKSKLYDAGAEFALMSGSGSAVFGIFPKTVNLRREFQEYFYFYSPL